MNGRLAILAILLATTLLSSGAAAAPLYSVNVTRDDTNIYSFTSGRVRGVIITKFCFQFAVREDAVLRYERLSYANKLIFDDGTTCDVAGVYVTWEP